MNFHYFNTYMKLLNEFMREFKTRIKDFPHGTFGEGIINVKSVGIVEDT